MNQRLERARRGVLWTAAALLVGCAQEAPVDTAPPNVVLISIDTLRADALSCYGNPRLTSPNIDALAASGVLFEDPVSPTSWTLPAHLSMLTGLSISAHGICDDRVYQGVEKGDIGFPLRGRFLSERLEERGYATGGFYSWKYLESEYGFGGGFDTYERIGNTVWSNPELLETWMQLRKAGDNDKLSAWLAAEPQAFDDHAPTSDLVVDRGLEWLEQRGEEPFFLFLHLFDTHNDYLPPAGFDRFGTDYVGPIDGHNVAGSASPVQPDMAPADLERLIALYHGEVAWVDFQIGRVLERLDAMGARENTLIVLTSDHGEEFFEHGHKIHRTHLYRESVQVPLIMAWPGRLPAGRRVEDVVGIIDIVPTVSELLDMPVAEPLSGRSLVPLIADEPTEPRVYLTELMDFSQNDLQPRRWVGLRADERYWMLNVESSGAPLLALIDRKRDVDEATFGYPVKPDSAEWDEFSNLLDSVRVETSRERNGAPARQLGPGGSTADNADELASMGYVDSGLPATFIQSDRLCLDGCMLFPSEPRD